MSAQGQYQASLDPLKQAVKDLALIHDPERELYASTLRSMSNFRLGDFAAAVQDGEAAQKVADQNPLLDSWLVVPALSELCDAYMMTGEIEKAEKGAREILRRSDESKKRRCKGSAL